MNVIYKYTYVNIHINMYIANIIVPSIPSLYKFLFSYHSFNFKIKMITVNK